MSNPIHIGKMIQARLVQLLIKRSTLAKSMGVPHSTIYAYEKRPSCSTDNLLRFCHALRYNFFADVARTLPAEYSHAAGSPNDHATVRSQDDIIAQQAELIKQLSIENNLLKELIRKG
jgi:DNA-binding XRE family transcriptional regulator